MLPRIPVSLFCALISCYSIVLTNGSASAETFTIEEGQTRDDVSISDITNTSNEWIVNGTLSINEAFGDNAYSLQLNGGDGLLSLNSSSGLTTSSTAVLRLNLNTFQGTLDLQGGLLRVSSTASDSSRWEAGMKIKLSNGGGLLVRGDENGQTLANDIEIGEGETYIRATGGSSAVSSFFFSGKLTGSGTLNRIDNGTLTLSGDVSGFTGNVLISGGNIGFGAIGLDNVLHADISMHEDNGNKNQTVALNGNITVDGNISLGDAAKVTWAGASNETLAIAEGGTINVGTLTVNQGRGISILTGGTLDVGTLTLPEEGGEINLSGGTLSGDYDLSGKTLSLSGSDVSTIAGTVTLEGSTLRVQMDDRSAAETYATLADGVALNGNFTLDLAGELSWLTTSEVTLISNTGTSAGTVTLTNKWSDDLLAASRVKSIDVGFDGGALKIKLGGQAATLVWKGGDGTWDYNNTVSWTGADGKFMQLDNVLFEGDGGTVTLDGELAPSVITVQNTGEYTITAGSGSLIGGGYLIKDGAGTLTVQTSNTFSSGVVFKAGRLVVDANGALGTGVLSVEDNLTLEWTKDVDLNNSGLSVADGKTLTLSGDGILNYTGTKASGQIVLPEDIKMKTTSAALADPAASYTVNGDLTVTDAIGANTTFSIQSGTGTIHAASSVGPRGGSGSLILIDPGEFAGTIELTGGTRPFEGGTLRFVEGGEVETGLGFGWDDVGKTFTTDLIIDREEVFIRLVNDSSLTTWAGKLSGSGNIFRTDGGDLAFTGDCSEYTGTIFLTDADRCRVTLGRSGQLSPVEFNGNISNTVTDPETGEIRKTGATVNMHGYVQLGGNIDVWDNGAWTVSTVGGLEIVEGGRIGASTFRVGNSGTNYTISGNTFHYWENLEKFNVNNQATLTIDLDDGADRVSLVSEEADAEANIRIESGGTLILNNGIIDATKLYVHDWGSGNSSLNIQGGVLNVLSQSDTGSKDSGFVIGRVSGGQGALRVSQDGVVNAVGNILTLGGDSAGALSISDQGEVNVKGILTGLNGQNATIEINGGRLNLGEGGIQSQAEQTSGTTTIDIKSGTLGMLDGTSSWESGLDIAIGGDLLVDTTWRQAADDGISSADDAENAGNITLGGMLTGSGTVIKEGSGSLILAGAVASGSTINLIAREGTLSTQQNINLGAGVTLTLDGGSIAGAGITLDSGYRLVSSAGHQGGTISGGLTLNGSGTISLGNLVDDQGDWNGTYDLDNGSLTLNFGEGDRIAFDFGGKVLDLNQTVRVFTNTELVNGEGWIQEGENRYVFQDDFGVNSGFQSDYTLSWENGALSITRTTQSLEVQLDQDETWNTGENGIAGETFSTGSNIMFGQFADEASAHTVSLGEDILAHIIVNIGTGKTLTIAPGDGYQLVDGTVNGNPFQTSLETQSGTTILTGSNNYSGGTILKSYGSGEEEIASELVIMESDSIGSGSVTFAGGKLIYGMDGDSYGSIAQGNQILVNDGCNILVDTQNNNVRWTSAISLNNTHGIVKEGSSSLAMMISGTELSHISLLDGTLQLDGTPALNVNNISVSLGMESVNLGDFQSEEAAISGVTLGASEWQVSLGSDVVDQLIHQLSKGGIVNMVLDLADSFSSDTLFSSDYILKGNDGLRYEVVGTDIQSGDVTLTVSSRMHFVSSLDGNLISDGNYVIQGYDSLSYVGEDAQTLACKSVTLDSNLRIELDGRDGLDATNETGLLVNKLQTSQEGENQGQIVDLVIFNSNAEERAFITLSNKPEEETEANSHFNGNIIVQNALDLVKSGEGTLTVTGTIKGEDIDLNIREGKLSVGSLDVGSIQGDGVLELTGDNTLDSEVFADYSYGGTIQTSGNAHVSFNLAQHALELGSLVVGEGTITSVLMGTTSPVNGNNILTLNGESVVNGTLELVLNTMENIPNPLLHVAEGASLTFGEESTLKLDGTSGQRYIAVTDSPFKMVIADRVDNWIENTPGIEFGTLFNKYYDNEASRVYLNDAGQLILETVENKDGFYGNSTYNPNLGEISRLGGELLDYALITQNPQYLNSDSVLAQVMTELDLLLDTGSSYYNPGDATRILASLAGSTVTALGMAQRDLLRDQMGWIRNRTLTMGVSQMACRTTTCGSRQRVATANWIRTVNCLATKSIRGAVRSAWMST